jgi:hypothetical protein
MGARCGAQYRHVVGRDVQVWGNIGLALDLPPFHRRRAQDRRTEHIFLLCGDARNRPFLGWAAMMHERYMYPALILLAVSALLVSSRNHLRLFVLFSLTQFAPTSL